MTDLEKRLTEWIDKGGFPFEMKVANSFIKNGFSVTQSVYYRDSDTGKLRETDIIATQSKLINNVWLNFSFVVECKKTTDKPWVVLRNDGLKVLQQHLPIYHTNNASQFVAKTRNQKEFKSDLLFRNETKFGYSVQPAFGGNGKDASYEAIQSVTKACEYFVNECNAKRHFQCNFYFPTIFIEGKLFDSAITPEDKIELSQTSDSKLIVNKSFHEHGSSSIMLFDSEKLDEKTGQLMKLCAEVQGKYAHLISKHIGAEN
jgi:hypothetical protein